jgi:magnesium-protoporphyrin O-methyltransferase
VWERLTSDAPVSRIRATVRAGRDEMRARLLSGLPRDLTGARILDAGCGTGQMSQELAARGADVVAVDISPSLIGIARQRMPAELSHRVRFEAGDMLRPNLGQFDHVVAMDSLIYYDKRDICTALEQMAQRTAHSILFTVAPRTPLLMAMWHVGRLFPRSDRSPTMIPQSPATLRLRLSGDLVAKGRTSCGFYISEALEYRP